MQKIMKSLPTKTVVVSLSSNDVSEHEIDMDTFEDPFVEAATRAIEKSKTTRGAIIKAVTECWDKKTPKKVELLNSYKILLNASCCKKAEELRLKFKMQFQIDLAKEPLHAKRPTK